MWVMIGMGRRKEDVDELLDEQVWFGLVWPRLETLACVAVRGDAVGCLAGSCLIGRSSGLERGVRSSEVTCIKYTGKERDGDIPLNILYTRGYTTTQPNIQFTSPNSICRPHQRKDACFPSADLAFCCLQPSHRCFCPRQPNAA